MRIAIYRPADQAALLVLMSQAGANSPTQMVERLIREAAEQLDSQLGGTNDLEEHQQGTV